jgi:hypothetical protein
MTDAEKQAAVTLNVVPGQITPGVWCNTCALPSAATAEVHLLGKSGVLHIGHVTVCLDCET